MDESVNNPPPPPAAAEVRGASQSHCCCLTCASVVNCHEDIDHPGDYYCTTCWEKYDEQLLSSSSSSCALLAPPTMTSSAVGRESELFPHDDDDGQPPSYPPTASKNTSIIVSRADPQPQKQNHPSSSKVADEEEDGEEETSGEEQVVVEVSTVNEKGQTLFSERGVEDEAVGGGGGAYFSTQPLASQPTLSTQDHDNSSTNRTMTTMMIPSMDQKPAISKEVDTITNTNHYLSETNQDNDVCMDYLEATETSLSVEYNTTTDNENREDDEIMGGDSMFGLLTQAAGAENGDDGTDVEDVIDDNEHIAPSTEEGIHCEEGRIADETVGFAQSIINTHERKTNLSTDQSPLIEAVMTATCLDSHGENNMALSGLTEPTTQPELSLHDSSNATLAAVEQCEAPHHGLPTTDKDITSFHHVNDDVGDDYKDTLDDDDASSAYNGLSEEEGEGNSLPDPDEATREHEGTEIANVGKQPPMQMQTVNSDSSKQVAPEESIPMDVENADIAMISMQIDESNVHCETMHAQCQPVEVDRHDAIVDNMHVPAATDQPSQRHQDGTTSDNENEDENISSSDTEMEDEMEHEHHEEGTGDTNVTFDSGYWSLYDGNTQKLPTEPSQMQDANSAMETSLGKPTTATKNCVDLGTEVISSSPPRAKPDIVDANKNDSLLDDAIHSEAGDDVLQVEPIHHASAGADNNVEGNASQPNGATCEQPPIVDAPKFDGIDEDETQLSQDLLASPAAKSNQFSQPAKPACNDVAVQDVSLNSSVSIGRELTPQRSPPPISDAKTEISDSKSLSIQKHRANETEWLQSTRNIHGTKDMLLMPSPKPLEKDGLDDSEDVGSDTQSWSGNGHNYADYAIEDTQNENEAREPSAFIRLSRDSSNLHHTSLTTMSVKNRKPNYSDRGVERSSIMKPKVLRYNALTKGDNDYSKSAESDASSEAEFDDDVCATKYIDDNHQSQTDKRILKQLEEVKAILPSVEEIQDIARKQLSDEMAKMEQSYRESIKKLKQENVKLVAQLKVAEESNRRKDQVIKEKNALLDEQFKVIEQVKRACGLKPPSLAECKSPVIRSSNKRKNASLPECQSKTNTNEDIDDDDSDDDDSDLPLSALRNTNISSNKKSRKSPVSSRAKVPTNKSISPTSLHNIDTASADTPLSDQSKAKSTMQSNLVSKNSRVLAPDVWKQLQEKGWRYQTGPEPHNKVYVPKDGATHTGTQLGIHFFDCDQVIAAAIERGDLTDSFNKSTSAIHSRQPIQLVQDHAQTKPTTDTPMDDSRFCDTLNLLTLESARSCIQILANFAKNDDHERFVGKFFTPLWQRLREQGSKPEMQWRYDANRKPLAKCNWCFVPPTSILGGKGKVGIDYFETEEHVALVIMKEVRAVKELSHMLADHTKSFSEVFLVLERSVDENLEYLDAKRGNSGSVRARRAASKLLNSPDKSPPEQPQKSGTKKNSVSEKTLKSSSKKTITKITPESKVEKNTTSLPKKVYKPSFHMSQTQGVETVLPSYNRSSPRQDGGPLRGFNFFYSGIDSSFTITDRITRLGGKVVQHSSLTVERANRKTFFLADYNCWRKMKYILATSLGVPMLHYQWIAELEQKFQEFGTAKPFDSELYKKYRLPLGLDLARGIFPLQRASNARSWDPPGLVKGAGEKVFQGMTIALAIEEIQVTDWVSILSACGATVKTLTDIQRGKGRINVDCCLLASTSLPPHSVSLPEYVSNLLRCLVENVPLLDLAWAHQSIIQRKRLPLVGDARYAVSLIHDMRNTCHVSAIKSKAGARYEIGDLVQFTRGLNAISSGRIVDIVFESQGRSCKLEIQLLDSLGDYDLIDYPSAAKITVNESSLKGNIMMLDTEDFHSLGYVNIQRNIFNRSANGSQV